MTLVVSMTIILRWLAFALAVWNMRWSYPGVCELSRGGFRPPAIYLSVVFLYALVVVCFQLAWAFGATDLWRLLNYVILTTAMGLATLGNRLGSALKARQFYGMYDHLDAALAVTDLARVAPVEAARIAAECRRLTAAAMVAAHV